MSLYVGATGISKVYLGSSDVQKVYLGSTEVWSASVPAVTYHATGAGHFAASGQLSYTITTTVTTTIFAWATHVSANNVTMSLSGGIGAMTLVDSQGSNNTNSSGRLFLFRKDNVPAGTYTITSTGMTSYIHGNAVAYENVGSVSAVTKKYTVTGAMSFPVTLNAGEIALAGWQHSYGGLTSRSGGTERYYQLGSSSFVALCIRDTASSATLTTTGGSGLYGGAGMMLVLSP